MTICQAIEDQNVTDRQTDRIAISILHVTMLSRNKNWSLDARSLNIFLSVNVIQIYTIV